MLFHTIASLPNMVRQVNANKNLFLNARLKLELPRGLSPLSVCASPDEQREEEEEEEFNVLSTARGQLRTRGQEETIFNKCSRHFSYSTTFTIQYLQGGK